jgi:hypothetical protein
MKQKHTITPQVEAVAAAWQAQPSCQSIMLEAKRRCKELKTLRELCEEAHVSYAAAVKLVFHTSY